MLNLQKKLNMFHLFPQPILHSDVTEKTPPCFVSNLFLWFSPHQVDFKEMRSALSSILKFIFVMSLDRN